MDQYQPHQIRMTFDSRLRYFDKYKDLILDTLDYDRDTDDLPDHIKVRLASAYLDIKSDD